MTKVYNEYPLVHIGINKWLNGRKINLCKFPLQDVELKFPPLKCGLHVVTSFQRVLYKKGEKVTLKKTDKHTTSARWSRLISTIRSHVCSMYPWYDVITMAFYLCDLPPQIHKPSSNHESNIRQLPVKGHSTKYLTSIPQNCQGHRKQGKPKKPHTQEESKETCRLNVMWDPGTEKGHLVIKQIWIKYGSYLKIVY